MSDKIKHTFIYIILLTFAFLVLFPFVWMILSSFKTISEIQSVPPTIIPADFQWSNYPEALSKFNFGTYFFNSVIVACLSTVFVLLVNSLGAFAFVKYDFKYKSVLLTLLIATMMVPGEMLIITNFGTISNLGLANTRVALFLPYMVSVFYLFLLKQFFEQVPHQLYLAAKVDGDSDIKFFFKILLPVAKPALITVAILNVISSWNAYLWPILIISDDAKRTLPIGLTQFTSEAGSDVQLLLAASVVTIIPLILLFIVTRKYVIGGLTKGAIKG